MSWWRIAIVVGAVAAVVVAAVVLATGDSGSGGDDDGGQPADGWLSYENDFLGFGIRYPDEWFLEERGQTARSYDPFITGGVTISKEAGARTGAKVLAYKNFQGDWCLRGKLVEREIVVSGIDGVETNCYDCEADASQSECPPEPHTIVRTIGTIGIGEYFVVVGDADGDVETVRRIVESFEFVE